MTGCLRSSCRLATWMILLTGVVRTAQADLPSANTSRMHATLGEGEQEQSSPQPDSQWLTQPCADDCAGLDPCGCEYVCPAWTVAAGAIILNRGNPDGDSLYQDNTDPLYGSDFHLGWESGFQIEVARRNINCGDDIVARLFFVDGWSADAVTHIPGDTQINSMPNIAIVGPRDIGSRLTSELTSFELDYYCQSSWAPAVKWLVGIRTLELDENMNTGLVYPGGAFPTVYHTVGVQNRLYGAQVGGEIKLLNLSRVTLQGFLMTGLYGNSAGHTSAVWDDVTAPAYVVDRHGVLSFVGETGVSGRYQLTDCLALRADYRVLWVTGVALATEQVPVSNFSSGAGIDTDGTAFYHGVFVGLDWSF